MDGDEELNLVRGEEEGEGWQYDLCLVGRFPINRPVNLLAMKHQLASMWRPRRGVSIQSID